MSAKKDTYNCKLILIPTPPLQPEGTKCMSQVTSAGYHKGHSALVNKQQYKCLLAVIIIQNRVLALTL